MGDILSRKLCRFQYFTVVFVLVPFVAVTVLTHLWVVCYFIMLQGQVVCWNFTLTGPQLLSKNCFTFSDCYALKDQIVTKGWGLSRWEGLKTG